MLALWHDSVPTLTAAFAQGSESFLQLGDTWEHVVLAFLVLYLLRSS